MEISDREILSYKNYIKKFSLSPDKYKVVKSNELKTPGSESNLIYWKGEYPKGIEFTFSDNAVNCRIFIGENIKAINSTISILSSNCLIYLGDRCNIKKATYLCVATVMH